MQVHISNKYGINQRCLKLNASLMGEDIGEDFKTVIRGGLLKNLK